MNLISVFMELENGGGSNMIDHGSVARVEFGESNAEALVVNVYPAIAQFIR